MRTLIALSAAMALLAITPGSCFALMDIKILTKEDAKELGMEIRTNAAGPDAVRIELEFEMKGEMKSYVRVDLNIAVDGKLFSHSSLKEDKSKPGFIVVSFAADRSKLEQFEVKVVTGDPGNLSGSVLRMKEFVELKKVK